MTSPPPGVSRTACARGAITMAGEGYVADAHARIVPEPNFFDIPGPGGIAGWEIQVRAAAAGVRAAVLGSCTRVLVAPENAEAAAIPGVTVAARRPCEPWWPAARRRMRPAVRRGARPSRWP